MELDYLKIMITSYRTAIFLIFFVSPCLLQALEAQEQEKDHLRLPQQNPSPVPGGRRSGSPRSDRTPTPEPQSSPSPAASTPDLTSANPTSSGTPPAPEQDQEQERAADTPSVNGQPEGNSESINGGTEQGTPSTGTMFNPDQQFHLWFLKYQGWLVQLLLHFIIFLCLCISDSVFEEEVVDMPPAVAHPVDDGSSPNPAESGGPEREQEESKQTHPGPGEHTIDSSLVAMLESSMCLCYACCFFLLVDLSSHIISSLQHRADTSAFPKGQARGPTDEWHH